MIFTIAVLGGHQDTQANLPALKFAESLIGLGHSINRIFFYHEGVNVALEYIDLPADEFNYGRAWTKFSVKNEVELAVCIANGSRRGIVKDNNSEEMTSLAKGFELVGLGQLIDAISNSDRYVEFTL